MNNCQQLIKDVFVYFIYLNLIVFCRGREEEGDSSATKNGKIGECIGVSNCESALELINGGTHTIFYNSPNLGQRVSYEMCKKYYPKLFDPNLPTLYIKHIVAGRKALAKEFPHMALIGYGDGDDISWLCGGSLISEKFVLTAAHCILTNRGHPQWIRLGELDTASTADIAEHREFRVVRTLAHPSYDPPSIYHDIGLLQLDRDVTFTDFIKPACLPQSNDTSSIIVASATGWGLTEFGGSSSSHLMEATLVIVNNTRCRTFYKSTPKTKLSEGIVDDTQICAGGNDGKDTCQGDSGGPLQVRKEESFKTGEKVYDLIGITSFGTACGLGGRPGVYTRISFYHEWIERIVWP